MELKVGLLNDSFPPIIDGVSNTVINYAASIHGNLGKATVITPKYPDTEDNYIFPVYRFPSLNTARATSGYRTGYPFRTKTTSELEKMGFDILHSHCPFASGVLARLLRQRMDSPYIFTYHTKFDIEIDKVFDSESMQKLVKRLMINNISAADEVWVVSKGAGENLRSMGYTGDTVVMENGVDMPAERVSKEKVAALRTEYHIPEDLPVFLFVGRLLWYKGMRLSLDAAKALKTTGKDFRFVIVGDGLDAAEMKEYAANIGIEDKCIFTGSIYDREKLRAFFALADLFLFPSTYDTNGLVVREAAASALPSVIVKDSCAAEGLTDGRNGLEMEETAESLTRQMLWACDNRDALARIGKCAQKEIYISWSDAVDKAYHRYEYLKEQMLLGKMPRKDIAGHTLYEMIADLNAANARLRRAPRYLLDKTGALYAKFKK